MAKKGTNAEEVLKTAGRTAEIKARIHKELGITAASTTREAKDMYEFEYKHPDSQYKKYIIVHGKCIEKGQKTLRKWGYLFTLKRHFEYIDETWCRVRCSVCKKRLNEAEAKRFLAERELRMAQEHTDYLEEKEIREEWEAEQILLGKL